MSLSLFHGVQDELYDSLNFSPQLQRRLTELIFSRRANCVVLRVVVHTRCSFAYCNSFVSSVTRIATMRRVDEICFVAFTVNAGSVIAV